ncbi:branched-chain amino acid ABC transporter permease, partial [Salmonella enterica subsp. enterica serovar Newport]|nr:branched-chain amino acid ABC transporter permease [Salmonella enterica subsp. enterica serovar Newport]
MSNETASDNVFARAIRDSLIAGVISFGLFFFFIGLQTTQNINNELIIVQRW